MQGGQPVHEGVYRLGTEWVNWFLVDDGGLTVVDCGFAGYHKQLPAALESLGRTIGEVEAVVLTHYHTDHVGSAERIRADAGARVYAPTGDAPAIRGEASVPMPSGIAPNLWRPTMLRYVAHMMRSNGARLKPVTDVHTYGDGEALDVPGGLRAIATSGHTGGHCSLEYARRGVLFAGDALGTRSFVSARTGPQVPAFNEDHGAARESLGRLEGVEGGLVLCGHGPPYEGTVAEAVALARRPG